MKKITYIIITLMLVLAPLKALAASRITLTEKENGVIDTKLHFDDGFIGGLDLNITLSDNVKVTKFDFNKDFAKNKYTTEYTYKDGTLNIKITTGGKNLLNEKKQLNLGTINLSTNSDKSVSYAINVNNMKVIDINLKSYELEKNAIVVNGQNIFTYEVANKDEQTEDKDDNNKTEDNNKNENENNATDNKNENTKPGESNNETQDSSNNVVDNNNTVNHNNSNNGNTTTTKPNTNNNGNSSNDNTTDENNNTSENTTDENEDNEKETTKENTSNKNEVHENNIPNFLKVVLVLIIVFAAVIIGILIKKLRKNK